MTNVSPSSRSNVLHSTAGVTPPTTEPTAFAAGNSIVYQNNGNTVLRIVCTTAGTGTVVALVSANNQAVTLPIGETLLGPYDQGVYGQSVTITTATAIGTVGTYILPGRFANGLRNPFETSTTAIDAQ